MFEILQEKITELDSQRKELNKQLFNTIQKEIVSVLDKYPEFIGIKWTQYIPGFNDGEPCIFSLNEPEYVSSMSVSEESNYTVKIKEEYYSIAKLKGSWDSTKREYVYANEREKNKSITLSEIASALYTVEDLLEEQFGSNAEVIITKEEIIVNSYDCGY